MAKIVFMGTPDFALPSLTGLIEHHEVIAVITQPDRPAGRSKQLRQSAVKKLALAADIPVYQPQRIRHEEAISTLQAWNADGFVVAAYGQILPQAVLDLPQHGTLNVHASLLPLWRGAAPIQAAIRAGDSESGATIMLIDAGLDTGPTLSKRAIPLMDDETGQSLHDKLARVGAHLLIDTLPRYLTGELKPLAQDESLATYAPQIKKEDGEIDWSHSAETIEKQVRAFTPWPGTFTQWNGTALKVLSGRAGEGQSPAGQVIEQGDAIAIGTADGLFFPTELQLAGKKRLGINDFANGYGNFVGAFLGRA